MITLVDCGCEARPHADGSGIEIDYCELHAAAPAMRDTLREIAAYERREFGATPVAVMAEKVLP